MNLEQFNTAILDLRPELSRFAYNLTKSTPDAEDLVQDAYVKALRYKSEFKDGTNLRAWLFTIVKNTFINNYRRTVKQKAMIDVTPDLFHLNNTISAGPETPESAVMADEMITMIKQVPDIMRVPFQLFNHGHKYEEIAERLDIQVGTVKSRIFHARRVLKGMVETGKGYKPELKTNFVKQNTFEPMEAEVIKFRTICKRLIDAKQINRGQIGTKSGLSWPALKKYLDAPEAELKVNMRDARTLASMDKIIAFNKAHADTSQNANEVTKALLTGDQVEHIKEKVAPAARSKYRSITNKDSENNPKGMLQLFIEKATFWELIKLASERIPDNVTLDIRVKK
jgi:RNA polymerase sigma-70 factor, ECF subfamily